MKKFFTMSILMAVAIFFMAAGSTMAGPKDTLTVFASVSTLDQIINSDTTSTGTQAHGVYKLVSRDTTYIFISSVSVKSDMTIIGVPGSDGRPPCIQPGILSDGSIPEHLFQLKGAGSKYTFKNLYLLGLSTVNTNAQWGDAIRVLSDNIKITCDNVIFEQWWGDCIIYFANWDSFFLTNCKFRNGNQPSWYSGEVLRNGWPGSNFTDTVYMKNNTILCYTAYAACHLTKKLTRYFEFTNNSVLWMFKNPFWMFNTTEGKVNNNIFYATYAGGSSKDEYEGYWDQLWSKEVGSIIDLDTLDAEKDSILTGSKTKRWEAEALRKIEIKNNVYFTPAELVSKVKSWNDTAHVDSVYTAEWMNKRTRGMFADKTHWPGLVESGNLNVDPGFGASILNVLYANTGSGVGFWQYFKDIRTGTATTSAYGYKMQEVKGDNWIPNWPLPEMKDMQYTNAALKTAGTDGKPVGDPGWFTGGYTDVKTVKTEMPSGFALFDAYPNPFNPSTNIKFNLAQNGKVSLKIYNVMGQLVKTVLDNVEKTSGQFEVKVNLEKCSSGIYFYTLTQGSMTATKKMILTK